MHPRQVVFIPKRRVMHSCAIASETAAQVGPVPSPALGLADDAPAGRDVQADEGVGPTLPRRQTRLTLHPPILE